MTVEQLTRFSRRPSSRGQQSVLIYKGARYDFPFKTVIWITALTFILIFGPVYAAVTESSTHLALHQFRPNRNFHFVPSSLTRYSA
jgi:hypothetical protein